MRKVSGVAIFLVSIRDPKFLCPLVWKADHFQDHEDVSLRDPKLQMFWEVTTWLRRTLLRTVGTQHSHVSIKQICVRGWSRDMYCTTQARRPNQSKHKMKMGEAQALRARAHVCVGGAGEDSGLAVMRVDAMTKGGERPHIPCLSFCDG